MQSSKILYVVLPKNSPTKTVLIEESYNENNDHDVPEEKSRNLKSKQLHFVI